MSQITKFIYGDAVTDINDDPHAEDPGTVEDIHGDGTVMVRYAHMIRLQPYHPDELDFYTCEHNAPTGSRCAECAADREEGQDGR